MKFAQKLACAILLVLAASFSVGGCVLLVGDFSDRLSAELVQAQARHNLTCYAVESQVLSLQSRGEPVDDATLRSFGEQLAAPEGDRYITLSHTESGSSIYQMLPAGAASSEIARLENGRMAYHLLTQKGETRVYLACRSDLLSDLTLVSTFDFTPVFAARRRSLNRFFVLEGVVLSLAALVDVWLSRRLTRPLARLTQASGEMAAGAYGRRTELHTGDELETLSISFDRMAAAVEEKVSALELSVRQRDDFMGAFAHELKTPMTAILGYADMLRTIQCDPAEQQEAAGAIFHEAKRLEALSGKLLELLQLSEEELALMPVPLDEVLAALRAAAAPALQGISLDAPPCGLVAMADADLLTDLLLNLVRNAAKASRPGQTVGVRFAALPTGIEGKVWDAGCGIPPEQLNRVTEPFYMVDKSRARQNGGSGLGLALCEKIAAAHGTQLTITSQPGQGTTVQFLLHPAKEVAAP